MAFNNISDALSKRISPPDTLDDVDQAYNEMFGLSEKKQGEKLLEIELDSISPHPLDPFRIYNEEKLLELAESIEKYGVLEPIIVRSVGNNRYEILAGKNRSNAAKLNGWKKIKAIVCEVDDETAIMIITDSNLKHREKLFPSEKAFAYKLQLDAIKRQGKRSDLEANGTSTQIAWKLETADIVAKSNDVSKDEVRRYIRLTVLLPELLELVDQEAIPLMTGVNLSYIDEEAQREVYKFFFESQYNIKLDLKASILIRDVYKEGKMKITTDSLEKILKKDTMKTSSKIFAIKRSKFKEFVKYLPDDEALENLFLEFLKQKFSK